MALILPLVVLAVMWVFLIRPQQQRVRAHAAFVASVAVGDEVVTTSGIHGTVVDIDGDRVRLRIAPDVVIVLARAALGHAPEPDDDAAVDGTTSGAGIDDRTE